LPAIGRPFAGQVSPQCDTVQRRGFYPHGTGCLHHQERQAILVSEKIRCAERHRAGSDQPLPRCTASADYRQAVSRMLKGMRMVQSYEIQADIVDRANTLLAEMQRFNATAGGSDGDELVERRTLEMLVTRFISEARPAWILGPCRWPRVKSPVEGVPVESCRAMVASSNGLLVPPAPAPSVCVRCACGSGSSRRAIETMAASGWPEGRSGSFRRSGEKAIGNWVCRAHSTFCAAYPVRQCLYVGQSAPGAPMAKVSRSGRGRVA
jgi:hypothetical protein